MRQFFLFALLYINPFLFCYSEGNEIRKNNFFLSHSPASSNKNVAFLTTPEIFVGLASFDGSVNPSYGFNLIPGVMMDHHINMGIGIGMHNYEKQMLLPVFIDLKVLTSKNKKPGLIMIAVGKSFGTGSTEGGLMLNPSVGIRIYSSNKVGYNFSIGYRSQKLKYRKDIGGSFSYRAGGQWSYFDIKFGITFR